VFDREAERDQAGVAQILCEGFFRERAPDAPIAVFERVYDHRNKDA
jgi:hypothetical protein